MFRTHAYCMPYYAIADVVSIGLFGFVNKSSESYGESSETE